MEQQTNDLYKLSAKVSITSNLHQADIRGKNLYWSENVPENQRIFLIIIPTVSPPLGISNTYQAGQRTDLGEGVQAQGKLF